MKPMSVEQTRKLMQHVKTLLPTPSKLTKYYDTSQKDNIQESEINKKEEMIKKEIDVDIKTCPTNAKNIQPLSVSETSKMMEHVRKIWSKNK